MKFLKKYGVAILVTALLIALSVGIGTRGKTQAENSYYKQWIIDEAGLLSEDTVRSLAKVNEELDKKYASVIGFITVDSLQGAEIGDYIYERAEREGFGAMDIVVLVSVKDNDWYLAYGDAMAGFTDNDLRLKTIAAMDGFPYGGNADKSVEKLYKDLSKWYVNHVPTAENNQIYQSMPDEQKRSGSHDALYFIIVIFVIILVVRYLIFPLCRYRSVGRWMPLWGWGLFPPFRSHRYDYHDRRGPPPPSGHGGFGGSHNGFGHGGGFGSSSRGGGGFGHGGGFGRHSR